MFAWLAISSVLLLWNVVYCARKVTADFKGPTPASGVWGLFALAGAVSVLALLIAAFMLAGSGV